jgi:BirA family biotin operon repressor/biotin-[acetyl-CoA-carboxylase] ligase
VNDFTSPTPAWRLQRLDVTPSTNDLARDLPPWHAVVAARQEAGRGRYGRSFASGPGGLWFSAVLPLPGGPAAWTGLALAVGWGIRQQLLALASARLESLRLRWPNDLMLENRKLGGILLEQQGGERCIAGVGLNVNNNPASEDSSLRGIVISLHEIWPGCPPAETLLPYCLEGVAQGWSRLQTGGLAGLMPDLNLCWGGRREVEVHPSEGPILQGSFLGIDEEGALLLGLPDGGGRIFPAHQVTRMVEI